MTQRPPSPTAPALGRWTEGLLPPNVRAGPNTLITDELAFKRFKSKAPEALVIGAHCTMDGVHFDLGEQGRTGDQRLEALEAVGEIHGGRGRVLSRGAGGSRGSRGRCRRTRRRRRAEDVARGGGAGHLTHAL